MGTGYQWSISWTVCEVTLQFTSNCKLLKSKIYKFVLRLKSAFTFIYYKITVIYSPSLYWPIKYQLTRQVYR